MCELAVQTVNGGAAIAITPHPVVIVIITIYHILKNLYVILELDVNNYAQVAIQCQ